MSINRPITCIRSKAAYSLTRQIHQIQHIKNALSNRNPRVHPSRSVSENKIVIKVVTNPLEHKTSSASHQRHDIHLLKLITRQSVHTHDTTSSHPSVITPRKGRHISRDRPATHIQMLRSIIQIPGTVGPQLVPVGFGDNHRRRKGRL